MISEIINKADLLFKCFLGPLVFNEALKISFLGNLK